jgi:hypothetical protein
MIGVLVVGSSLAWVSGIGCMRRCRHIPRRHRWIPTHAAHVGVVHHIWLRGLEGSTVRKPDMTVDLSYVHMEGFAQFLLVAWGIPVIL